MEPFEYYCAFLRLSEIWTEIQLANSKSWKKFVLSSDLVSSSMGVNRSRLTNISLVLRFMYNGYITYPEIQVD